MHNHNKTLISQPNQLFQIGSPVWFTWLKYLKLILINMNPELKSDFIVLRDHIYFGVQFVIVRGYRRFQNLVETCFDTLDQLYL